MVGFSGIFYVFLLKQEAPFQTCVGSLERDTPITSELSKRCHQLKKLCQSTEAIAKYFHQTQIKVNH